MRAVLIGLFVVHAARLVTLVHAANYDNPCGSQTENNYVCPNAQRDGYPTDLCGYGQHCCIKWGSETKSCSGDYYVKFIEKGTSTNWDSWGWKWETYACCQNDHDKNNSSSAGAGGAIGGAIAGVIIVGVIVGAIAKKQGACGNNNSGTPAQQPAPAPVAAVVAPPPVTPQEIELGNISASSSPKFDPMTGEPVAAPSAPIGAKFDPQTGAPIPKFDPHTGKQNW